MTRPLDLRGVVAGEHAAAARGDDLVAVEREHPERAEAPGGPPAVGGAKCFGRVFDHRHAVRGARREDRLVARALSVEVDDDRGRGLGAALTISGCELLLDQRGVDVPGVPLAVEEHRAGPRVGDGVRGRGKGERRHEDVVARLHAEEHEREVERGGAARQRRRVTDPDEVCELALERVDVRSERRDPVGVERVEQQLPFARPHVGRREEQAGHGSTVP